MNREEIEALRERVSCAVVLEQAGFAVDVKESTRRAVKFRRGSEIIIVTHEGRGWFDPLSDAKGDVFGLIEHLDHVGFLEGAGRVADLVGFAISEPEWQAPAPDHGHDLSLRERWQARRRPWPGSSTWAYLNSERFLPAPLLRATIRQDRLREGPYGSMWAAHTDNAGIVTGWEARGPEYRGFASGGTKVLFRLGPVTALRLAVTEAAIDAMSLAAIEGPRDGTVYLSTGGGWSPSTEAALRLLASRSDAHLVAATDANPQGEMFAERLRALADEAGCDWSRLRPTEEDWNETLKIREKEKRERKEGGVPHSRRPRQGKLRPAEPALDPAGRDAGGPEGVMKD
ncbi:DUF3991 domain-containing protein [Agrobacterium tumefaciens]|uniref:DUF3991 domain-containing protein n=2 Tax=Rhizobium/Agrobacterium group TaxID=227290 RepID=Q9KW94_RHIRH|nr:MULTISPECIES: DUF3991 and toprim domain-containing protein [Rhizobium/Agrobacterium group]ASK42971.1 hypothetical protein [Rhizobium rhizogenes]MCZ7977377.1 DUF3991 and toprim domain-containing protein [Agrobacterium salinitolerans]MDA5243186.1 DUF3991 and toprim domain-containing protein [Agrobacterium sp. MAFF310724]MDA5247632.1 DUF3991 and toprim domain-containing protein [Agrobacterium sp. MAFF210268]TRB03300.1 DUF3991 domain-containing protein [Agrobacterium tumefaciens]